MSIQDLNIYKMQKYKKIKKISEGAFGCVYEYKNLQSSEKIPQRVAIKEMYSSGNIKRQLQILRDLPEHQNILKVYEIIQDNFNVSVVMQYGCDDLVTYMVKIPYPIHERKVKIVAKQILQGLKVLHERKYIHRDMKPSNVILKENGKLALCDFGSAVKCIGGQQYEIQGFTRCYKAPQMLLGSRTYQYEIDIWSLGCILMELATGQPYFGGKSQIQQLSMIARQLGNPNQTNWPSLKKLPDFGKISFKEMKEKTIQQISIQRSISQQLSTFIKKMIKYDNRSSINELLNDPYLKDLQDDKIDLPTQNLSRITKESNDFLKNKIKSYMKEK